MTRIKKMVMHGFKSFARRTEMVFGENFNCVLGPNGSGKSNVLDALCFVLGRSSSKSLRAEKSANLIYNGGKSKKPMKQGEVSITFDNSKNIFPMDTKDIEVTRIVKGNGQSKYKINSKTSTRQQILDLLGHAKINPDGFNIILQGDIVRFVEMSSTERRKIIEEISGISVYEEKKNKALRELEKVDERLREAEIIMTERKTYLHELKKERDQALKYKGLSDKVSTNKASYVFRQIEKREKKKKDFDDKISVLKKKMDKTEAGITDIKNKIQKKKQGIQDISDEIEQKGEKEQVALHKQVEQIKVNLATNKTRIDNCKGEIVRIIQRKEQLQSDLKTSQEQLIKLEEEKTAFQNEKVRKESELKKLDTELDKFKKKKNIDSAADIEQGIEELDKEAEELQREIQKIREDQQRLLRLKDQIEFQIKAADDAINKVIEVAKENKDQIQELKDKKKKFRETVEELNISLNNDSGMAREVANSRTKLVSSQEELTKLNARSLSIKEKVAGNIALKKIIEQKSINGVYGTVSDLGEVNSEYSTALEVAAGSRLNSVVVEDDKVASKCIQFLKKNKFGVVTFIPLNKIKPKMGDVEAIRKNQGVLDLALNLITFKQKFRKVFEYIFSDTLVVDNIDTARKIGIGKARMVTIDGDMTEKSGVMRGGFRQKKHAAGFQERELTTKISEYNEAVKNLKNSIATLEGRKTANESKIVELRQLKANLEGDVITLEKTLHLESGDLEVSQKKKEELNKELADVEKQLETVSEKVTEFNKALAENKMSKQELRTRINQLRNPTVVAELNAFNEKRQELRDDLIKFDSEMKNLNAQIGMVSSEGSKIKEILKQHAREIEDFDKEIKDLEEKVKDNETSLKDKEQKEKEFYSRFRSLFNQRTQINDEIQKFENKVDAMREVSRETEIKLNTVSLENAKIIAELAGLNQEFEQYEGVKLDKTRSEEELKREINKFERMVQDMSAVNMKALEIYDTIEQEYGKLLEKKDMLITEKDEVVSMIEEIEDRKKEIFVTTMNALNENFQKFFSVISTKGEASLVLENPKNPFEEGVRIMVRLTGTKFMDIRSLSGGEKTMTALAFIFAIQEHDPHSFYVLDEVDAALDKRNSEKFAKLISSYVDRAQYIVISHNDGVISEANLLYGVSMDEHGISKVTSLRV